MELNRQTRLKDIVREYPWLIEELQKRDPRLEVLNSPFGRLMIRMGRIEDVEKHSGFSSEEILSELQKLIDSHQ